MKILWVSNAPWYPSGYGQQTMLFAPRLRDLGHDVAIFALCGLQGSRIKWNGIRVYPGANDIWGNDIAGAHAGNHFKQSPTAGVVITLVDVFVFNCFDARQYPVASWTPVDHDPVPPPVQKFFANTGAVPIAMSRFGEDRLRKAGLDPLYVPHGIDTAAFHPMDRREARSILGLPPDGFVVGMVAANRGNPSRKSFAEVMEAFARIRQNHPESILYLHTDKAGNQQGINLEELSRHLGIPDDAVVYCDQYNYWLSFPAAHMRATFSAMDVLLNPSRGEGFGIPIVEAQACGTPVIVSDFTAMPELVGAGWKVRGQRIWTAMGSWQFVPDVDDIVAQIENAYAHRGDPLLREKARRFAMDYDAGFVTQNHWKPALAEMQRRLGVEVIEAVPGIPV